MIFWNWLKIWQTDVDVWITYAQVRGRDTLFLCDCLSLIDLNIRRLSHNCDSSPRFFLSLPVFLRLFAFCSLLAYLFIKHFLRCYRHTLWHKSVSIREFSRFLYSRLFCHLWWELMWVNVNYSREPKQRSWSVCGINQGLIQIAEQDKSTLFFHNLNNPRALKTLLKHEKTCAYGSTFNKFFNKTQFILYTQSSNIDNIGLINTQPISLSVIRCQFFFRCCSHSGAFVSMKSSKGAKPTKSYLIVDIELIKRERGREMQRVRVRGELGMAIERGIQTAI